MKNDTHQNSKVEEAVAQFLQGYNCCQAVFGTYGPQLGIDREIAIKTAEAFGGSIMGETCGAVSGALMTIGLKYGRTNNDEKEKKVQSKEISKKFLELFKNRHNTLKCKDLLGHDVSTPEGNETASQKNLFKTLCPNYVRDAAQILEPLIN